MQGPFISIVCAVFLLACGDSTTPPRIDGGESDGPLPGDGTVPGEDTDNDGVCDSTEIERGFDPTLIDTDDDGFSDYAEVVLGFNAVDPAIPDRETIVILRETAVGALQVPLTRTIRGEGEDYSGAFQAIGEPDAAGDTALTFYTDSVATFAEPAENVAIVDEEGEAFRGVVGNTLLGFEVRFEFGGATPRGCARGYTFRYNIKRSDGRIVGVEVYHLIVLPAGQTLMGSADWCLPVGGCV